ncbi:hypothetical protein [Paraburkholderia sp. J12]|uniref:hypothetical protein n=1 Tax=Paraburkholderia sp. J12 TaxID=2805432 RepID=UPI002ABE9E72|nr:hypothetical protein [Paraburkholderia sp. J12]
MDQKKAERLLVDADRIAEFAIGCFELSLDAVRGRELYERAFNAYIRSEAGEVPMDEIYDALKGAECAG